MSKIGKMPISFASSVTVSIQANVIQIAGPKGNAIFTLPEGITAAIAENVISLSAQNVTDRKVRAVYGLTRANLANVIKGLDTGFEKKLELVGVGYRAQMQGTDLVLSLGFSHPVRFSPLPGLTLSVADNAVLVSGSDKVLVGQMAAKIRAVRPPEPYKGKGIKYAGEKIRRKAGKAAKAGSK
jgi:large subunit ribosomal protein L6